MPLLLDQNGERYRRHGLAPEQTIEELPGFWNQAIYFSLFADLGDKFIVNDENATPTILE